MKLKYVLFSALLGLASTAFAASTPAPAAGTGGMPHPGMKYCSEHAQECKDNAAKFDQWCAAHGDKCIPLKAWAEKHIEYCQAHEKECAEHRHMMREHMKEWCGKHADNEHCQKMKDKKDSDEDMDETAPPK